MRLTGELNLSEYGKHRGCSKVAVHKAIKSGRISVRIDEKGTKWINPISADAEWLVATKAVHTAKLIPEGNAVKVGRPKASDAEAIRLVREAKKKDKAEKMAAKKFNQATDPNNPIPTNDTIVNTGKEKKAKKTDELGEEREAKLSLVERANIARTRKLEAEMEDAEIDLMAKKRTLVLVDEFEDQFAGMVAKARDSFLHLPKSFMVAFQGANREYSEWLQERIESILSDMAGGQASNE